MDDVFLREFQTIDLVLYLVLPLLLVIGMGAMMWRDWRQLLPSMTDRIDAVLKYLSVVLFIVSTLAFDSGVPAVFFNIAMFMHSILYLLSGMEHLRWQRVAFGSFILAGLIFVRFLDLFDSLLLRSLAFIGLGVGLFVVGIVFSRQKEKELAHV
jgi:hypothetical protein